MNCPKCKYPDAYIGFNAIECCNGDCEHYNEKHAKKTLSGLSDTVQPIDVSDTDLFSPDARSGGSDVQDGGKPLGPFSTHPDYDYYSYHDAYSDFG